MRDLGSNLISESVERLKRKFDLSKYDLIDSIKYNKKFLQHAKESLAST